MGRHYHYPLTNQPTSKITNEQTKRLSRCPIFYHSRCSIVLELENDHHHHWRSNEMKCMNEGCSTGIIIKKIFFFIANYKLDSKKKKHFVAILLRTNLNKIYFIQFFEFQKVFNSYSFIWRRSWSWRNEIQLSPIRVLFNFFYNYILSVTNMNKSSLFGHLNH